jgi:hypothetical protein
MRKLPPAHPSRRPIIGRIDDAAKSLNPLLILVAAILAIVDISAYSALELGRRYRPQSEVTPPDDAPATRQPGDISSSPVAPS